MVKESSCQPRVAMPGCSSTAFSIQNPAPGLQRLDGASQSERAAMLSAAKGCILIIPFWCRERRSPSYSFWHLHPRCPILSQEHSVVWLLGVPDLDRVREEEISAGFSPRWYQLDWQAGQRRVHLNAPWGLEWNSLHQSRR